MKTILNLKKYLQKVSIYKFVSWSVFSENLKYFSQYFLLICCFNYSVCKFYSFWMLLFSSVFMNCFWLINLYFQRKHTNLIKFKLNITKTSDACSYFFNTNIDLKKELIYIVFKLNYKFIWIIMIKDNLFKMRCMVQYLYVKPKRVSYWFLRAITVVLDIKVAINYDIVWTEAKPCY